MEKQYLTGGWFEDYIYDLLKQKLRLSNTDIGKGIEIKRKNERGETVENELDIVFTYYNQLYVIECKAGLQGPKSFRQTKNIKKSFEEAIYKLKALQSEFGLIPRSYLFTLDNNIFIDHGSLNPQFIKRASMHRVTIISPKEIKTGLDQFIRQLKKSIK